MSEQEIRDGLKLAVADEPPMNFDLDELVTTAERLARRRRALIAVGASTAAVAVAAVAIPVLLGNAPKPDNLPVASSPSASLSQQVPPTSQNPPVARTKDELTQRGAEMQVHLRTQVPLVVPNAKQVNVGLFGGEAEGAVEDGQRYLGSFVSFTLGVRTAIEVNVQLDSAYAEKNCDGCQPLPQPDGSTVVIQTTVTAGGDNKQMIISSASHLRKDGSVVRVSSYNCDPTSQTGSTYQQAVALTVDQLVRLATDPALHL